jgi:hypothetical protein
VLADATTKRQTDEEPNLFDERCSRKTAVTPEPFVSAEEAARFLSIKRRYLLTLARRGIAGAYAFGTGSMRRVWVFRLSELAVAVEEQSRLVLKPQECVTMRSGSLRAERNI